MIAIRDIGLVAFDSMTIGTALPGKGKTMKYEADDSVLIVRLDAIGDFIVWLDAAEELRRHYADAKITLVANALWADLAASTPYFDEVIPVDLRRFRFDLRYRYRFLYQLRQVRYRTAIHFIYRRKGRFADAEAIVRAARADEKTGSVGEGRQGWRQRWSNRWYTELLPASDAPLMELRRNTEFLRYLGVEEAQAGAPTLLVNHLPVVSGIPNDYYVLVPGAGADFRRWPACRFSKIADRVHEATGWTGLISGAPSEKNLGERLAQQTEAPLENWAGRTSVPEMAYMIAQSNLVIGNETGAIHVAAAVSTPSVCILGGGHYGRFVPYDIEEETSRSLPQVAVHDMPCFHCDWNCVFDVPDGEAVPCITNVTVEDVWKQVKRVLQMTETSGQQSTVSS